MHIFHPFCTAMPLKTAWRDLSPCAGLGGGHNAGLGGGHNAVLRGHVSARKPQKYVKSGYILLD